MTAVDAMWVVLVVGVDMVVVTVVRVAAMRMTPMGVSMVVEEEETNNVGCQSEGANDYNEARVLHLSHVDEALQRLHEDGEAERQQEHAVDQRTQDLGALPSIRVPWVARLVAFLREL